MLDEDGIKHLWADPQIPTSGHADINAVFASVGKCMTEWEAYESCLANLFSTLVGGVDPTPARVAFGAVRTFEGRLAMLRQAYAGYTLNRNTRFVEIERVFRWASKFSPIRNKIAHGAVRDGRLARPDIFPEYGQHCLFAGYADSVQHEKINLDGFGFTFLPKYGFTVEQMIEISETFDKIRGDAAKVIWNLRLYQQNGAWPEPEA